MNERTMMSFGYKLLQNVGKREQRTATDIKVERTDANLEDIERMRAIRGGMTPLLAILADELLHVMEVR